MMAARKEVHRWHYHPCTRLDRFASRVHHPSTRLYCIAVRKSRPKNPAKDILLILLVLCCSSLLTRWLNNCSADWLSQAGSNRKAGRGLSIKFLCCFFCIAFKQLTKEYKCQLCKRGPKTSIYPGTTHIRFVASAQARGRVTPPPWFDSFLPIVISIAS